MEKKDNYISFDVNETLYFEHGQEIEEMLSISLDPDISLQMYEAYVQIRGIILLHGAYKKSQNQHNNSHKESVTAHIEKITDRNDDEAEFSHRFPLDISIPRERVHELDDVSVMIHAFDYELPDHQTLKIKSAIHIIGIYDEVESESAENLKQEEPQTVVTKDEATVESEPADVQETPALESDREEESGLEQEKMTDEIVEANTLVENQTTEIDISLKESKDETEEDEVKDVQFLTDLFGGSNEETHSTVTIYIIQEEDTVESIAKRFEIPALQLIKDNNLSGEDIAERQLLHINRN